MSPYSLQRKYLAFTNLDPQDYGREYSKAIFDAWWATVYAYSLGKLTIAEDKLIATSSIAREFKSLIKSQYLAGLWKNAALVRQLNWYTLSKTKRPLGYRAPSWSWASIDGRVSLYDVDDSICISLIEILGSQIELASEDEMGQLKEGFLDIRGQLIQFDRYVKYPDSRNRGHVVSHEANMDVYMDVYMDDEDEGPPMSLYCLPITLELDEQIDFLGLALEPTDKSNEYRRVGHIRLWRHWGIETLPEQPILALIGAFHRTDDGDLSFVRNTSKMISFKLV